jgi:hypothetical protein
MLKSSEIQSRKRSQAVQLTASTTIKRRKQKKTSQRYIKPIKETTPPPPFSEAPSIKVEAQRYLLGIAKLHLKDLNCHWLESSNRLLDLQHVKSLLFAFQEGKLDRYSQENYIQVTCSSNTYSNACQQLGAQDTAKQPVDLLDWNTVTQEKFEVINGQHRINALQEYIKKTDQPATSEWWICCIYNKGIN